MLLINCNIHLEQTGTEGCVTSSNAGAASFKITSTKLYVPNITLQVMPS